MMKKHDYDEDEDDDNHCHGQLMQQPFQARPPTLASSRRLRYLRRRRGGWSLRPRACRKKTFGFSHVRAQPKKLLQLAGGFCAPPVVQKTWPCEASCSCLGLRLSSFRDHGHRPRLAPLNGSSCMSLCVSSCSPDLRRLLLLLLRCVTVASISSAVHSATRHYAYC